MATVSAFLVSYPEFSAAVTNAAGLIEAKIADAEADFDPDVMGAAYDKAVMMQAAVYLMRSPWARSMRLEAPDSLKAWEAEIARLKTAAVFGLGRVAGGC